MSKNLDLRQIKDKAAKAVEKRNYAKAAELFLEIAQHESDPDWRQRAGEALRKANKPAEAAEQFVEAADGYAQGGFLLKAIAVCKVVLQLDPKHTMIQKRLADLYAMRDGSTRTDRSPSGSLELVAPVDLGRTASGNFTVSRAMPPPAAAPAPMRAPVPMRAPAPTPSQPPSIAAPTPIFSPPLPSMPVRAPEVPLSEPIAVASLLPVAPVLPRGGSPIDLSMDTVSLPPGAPMDALPLASLLGGRKSQSMPAIKPEEYGLQLDGIAYEIELETGPKLEPLPLSDESGPHRIDPREMMIEAEPTRTPAPQPAPPPVRVPPPVVAPPPVAASPPVVASPPGDELDFSSVMDDSASLPPSRPVAPPRPAPPPAAMRPPAPVAPPRSAPPAPPARPAPVAAPPAASSMDELDFSSVMDEAPTNPKQAAQRPPEPPAALPVIPLFSSLTADELQKLIEGVEVRDFEPGEVIVRQGDPGVALYVVVHGRVEVALEGPPRRPQAVLGEGAFFGELALLTDFPRSATVVALDATQLLEISRELVARVIAESPDVLKVLLRFFRDRMLDRLLSTSPVFSKFTPDDARGLIERFKFLEIDPKTRVIREGERAPGLFLLLCGEASVLQAGKAIAKLQPGDLFGEMSMLQRGPAMASIDTHTKCWALQLVREDFQEIMLTYPQLLEFVADLADKRRAAATGGKDGHVQFL